MRKLTIQSLAHILCPMGIQLIGKAFKAKYYVNPVYRATYAGHSCLVSISFWDDQALVYVSTLDYRRDLFRIGVMYAPVSLCDPQLWLV